MDYCDELSVIPPANVFQKADTSFKVRSIFYLINERDDKCLSDSIMKKYIVPNTFIQREIKKSYYRLYITFFHKSGNTDVLVQMKSSHFLSDCNNDIVAQYEWDEGRYRSVDFYKNGNIEGTEDIKLEELSPSSDSISK